MQYEGLGRDPVLSGTGGEEPHPTDQGFLGGNCSHQGKALVITLGLFIMTTNTLLLYICDVYGLSVEVSKFLWVFTAARLLTCGKATCRGHHIRHQFDIIIEIVLIGTRTVHLLSKFLY